jgi:hypothetical protein
MWQFHKKSITAFIRTKPAIMSNTNKQIQYRAILDKFENTYGTEHTRNQEKPVVISVTGEYRNKFHDNSKTPFDWGVFVSTFALISYLTTPIIAGIAAATAIVLNQRDINAFSSMFDGEIMEIDGVLMGVVIMTQKEEGEWESRNFVETNDKNKLINKLNESKLVYDENNVVTWSIGSNTGQCVDGQSLAPFSEVEMGVDMFSDEDIKKFLDAHSKILGHDCVLVLMNSIGYGVKEDGGIVYNDNTMEYETILDSLVPRTVGGTGNNAHAMKLVERAAKIHKKNKYDYTLAIVPRGDKTMPQGGSHSKQRVLEHFLDDEDVIVIEVSGKQTKKFDLPSDKCSRMDSSEKICKCMKEVKILDENGKTHGSQQVFGKRV